jgi:RNA polymerase sigma-32 factor
MGRLATANWSVLAESGLARYLKEVQQLPMLEPHEGYLLAKRWREHGDREAAHRLVTIKRIDAGAAVVERARA